MSSIYDMVNRVKQNRALRSSRTTFKNRKSDIYQNVFKIREYDHKEIQEERLKLKKKIRLDKIYKIVLLIVLLVIISLLIYQFVFKL